MAADLHPCGPHVLWSYSFSSCLVCKSRQPTHPNRHHGNKKDQGNGHV